MSKEIYQDILNRIELLESTFENIEAGIMNTKNPSKVLPDEEMRELDSMDYLAALAEIDSFKRNFPDTYEKYFLSFYNRYMKLFKKVEYELELMERKPKYDRDNDIPVSWCYNTGGHLALIRLHNLILEVMRRIEGGDNETVEKLKPIEKILIVYYLNQQNKLFKNPIGQFNSKQGKYFLSRLFEINPESIKNPVAKISDYALNEVTVKQAELFYPTLDKVRIFFDESDLKVISNIVEVRIQELKRIAGKD